MRYPKALLLAALVLTSCEQGTGPVDLPHPQAAAVVSHGSSKEPVDLALANPCNGELVLLSGSIHTTFSFVSDAAGGAHFRLSTNAQGISGRGTVTGAKYSATGAEHSRVAMLAGGTTTESVSNSFQLVGQGTVPNFRLHVTQHLTINANGVATAVVDKVSSSCN